MPEFKETYPAARFDGHGKHVGPGRWLDVIRKANEIAHAETGDDGPFGAPTTAHEGDVYVEHYDIADVIHDFPYPFADEPAYPADAFSIEWDRVSRERSRLHDVWVRDPRNTITIVSKTDDGARLLKRAHENLFTVVGVLSYDPETDTLS